ncbi:hypothetical protein B9Z19DRAFT_1064583 [Tuber borchii]|uniref:Protein kinase domain-containing protein n=1 Tax=Tuber borchii TaxID=42251 RepID=A0A2T6ZU98_TUBBO|nr:hypothetical protein B9Z19DRAFT_1064583 [Tuber borchii]
MPRVNVSCCRILINASNIFVASMSPVALEFRGLDSNSETSEYANSVDIWSLGCVIYELLVGTRLLPLEGQLKINEDGGENQEEVTQGQAESTLSGKRENNSALSDRPKKRRSKRNQIIVAHTRCIPGGVGLGAGAESQSGDDPSSQKTVVHSSMMTPSPADAPLRTQESKPGPGTQN